MENFLDRAIKKFDEGPLYCGVHGEVYERADGCRGCRFRVSRTGSAS